MGLSERVQSVDYEDGDKSSGSGFSRDQITEMLWNKISLEQPKVLFCGEGRYLTPLWVSRNEEPWEEVHRSDSITTSFEMRTEITYKIRAALKLLTFREQHVLVQFWSPRVIGKHQLLTTVDQPFGLGVAHMELGLYRRVSEHNAILVDKDHEEGDLSPPARVFRQGLPEWTFDLTNYKPRDFPLQDWAIRCNLHGYLALPVFDSTTGLCVGVLELLTSFKCSSYAFEVQQVHRALKTENLTSPQVYDSPTLKIPSERKQNDLDQIFSILKIICDTYSLPLAQTWAESPSSSFVSHNKVIEKGCSSFDTRCIGKVCMSTDALPFQVRNLAMWPFREACREQHSDKSHGFVGRTMLTHGSCYCHDVTELSEEEYPLVHYARMSGLTSCFTIFLHNVEGNGDDYVLEFFLLLNNSNNRHIPKLVLDLVQTLKKNIKVASAFELDDISPIEVIGPPSDVSYLSSSIMPDTIQVFSTTTAFGMDSSDSESFLANVAKTDAANVSSQCSFKQSHPNKQGGIITNTEKLVRNDVINENTNVVGSRRNSNATSDPNVRMQKTDGTSTNVGKKSQILKQGRKRKIDSLTMKSLEQHAGKPIGQAAKSLAVSRSTLKRFCREHGISSWPLPLRSNKEGYVADSKLSQELWSQKCFQRSSSPCFAIGVVVFVVLRVKRWSCSSKNHGFSGRWWSCGKHSYLLSKTDSIYQKAIPHRASSALYFNTGNPKHTTNTVHTYLNVDQQLSDSALVNVSSTQSAGNVLDMGLLTVKATFNDDMIKFRFPISSGLLELENEVAQRVNVNSKKISLKYKDEDNDLVLITCDTDLHTLPEFLASNTTLKLLVQLADD